MELRQNSEFFTRNDIANCMTFFVMLWLMHIFLDVFNNVWALLCPDHTN